MPGEKLYGLPGPQNSQVLMDIITKLKQELHQSRAENHKLVDQLNCLISLVKRAWSGEQGATLHLANIVGMDAPAYSGSEMNRNTPLPEKTRAVQNWERLAIKLLEREYAAIQREIMEKQRLYMQNRQLYMAEIMEDHKSEMSKYALHKKSGVDVEEVDRRFMRCFSAKSHDKRSRSAPRPRSAYQTPPRRAADMAERAQMTTAELLGVQQGATTLVGQVQGQAFAGLHRMSSGDSDRKLYRPREQFDDPNRYKQSNLFDPDVIFSSAMMDPPRGDAKSRPLSAVTNQDRSNNSSASGMRVRPKSAVFITESKPSRPLRYETTRPVSAKTRAAGGPVPKGRRHSAPHGKPPPPASFSEKKLHTRNKPSHQHTHPESPDDQSENHNENNSADQSDHMTNDNHLTRSGDLANNENGDQTPEETIPISVQVKKPDAMNQFVEELRLMGQMEIDFKKSTLELQKKLGLETDGFIY